MGWLASLPLLSATDYNYPLLEQESLLIGTSFTMFTICGQGSLLGQLCHCPMQRSAAAPVGGSGPVHVCAAVWDVRLFHIWKLIQRFRKCYKSSLSAHSETAIFTFGTSATMTACCWQLECEQCIHKDTIVDCPPSTDTQQAHKLQENRTCKPQHSPLTDSQRWYYICGRWEANCQPQTSVHY